MTGMVFISPEIQESITNLLENQMYPIGRFTELFDVDDAGVSKRGGCGIVYKARCDTPPYGCDIQPDSFVAVKEIELDYHTDSSTLTTQNRAANSASLSEDSRSAYDFLVLCQESVIIKNQNNPNGLAHINIVTYHTSWIEAPEESRREDIFDDLVKVVNANAEDKVDIDTLKKALKATKGMKIYVVMDYYDCNLIEFFSMTEFRNMSQDDLISIILDISRAIEHIHSEHYIHRDIKPNNILIRKENNAYTAVLCDFGLCRTVRNGPIPVPTNKLERLGTPCYNAYPEEYAGTPSDMWAFGILLLELLSAYQLGNKFTELVKVKEKMDLLKVDFLRAISRTEEEVFIKKQVGSAQDPMSEIILKCLANYPTLRPTASDVRHLYDFYDLPVMDIGILSH